MVDDETSVLRLLKALAHPVRLGIMRQLTVEDEIRACAFTEHFPIAQSTLSAHLRTLREAGLVSARYDGNTRHYSLIPEALSELVTALSRMGDTGTGSRLATS